MFWFHHSNRLFDLVSVVCGGHFCLCFCPFSFGAVLFYSIHVCLALFCLSVYISAWIDLLCLCIYLHDIYLQCSRHCLALVVLLIDILWAIFKPIRDRSSGSHAVTLFKVFCFSDFSLRLFMLFKASKSVLINLKKLGTHFEYF